MKPPVIGWRRWMLVVTIAFCILGGARSIPIYPPPGAYPAVDPYSPVYSAYPAVDPYAPVYGSPVDVYYQVPQPVSYPTLDPYAQPVAYPAVDPYGMPPQYVSIDPYGLPPQYPSADPYAYSQYPSVDPYGMPPQYPSVDPYGLPPQYPSVDPYGLPPQYPSVDPYGLPPQYPSVDPYAPQPYPSVSPYPDVLLYPPVDPYQQPYPMPQVDPYAQPYPSPYPDPYAPQPYPSPYPDPYAPQPYPSPYPDPYAPQPYPSPYPDPYAPSPYPDPYAPSPYPDPYAPSPYPDPYAPQPYPSPYPDPYAPQPYPSVDPYAPQPYPSVDPYALPSPPPSPYPSVDPYALSIPSSYAVAPAYPPPSPSPVYVVEDDTYLAVTDHNKDRRKHCGILAVTNDDIYSSDPMPGGVNDVLPYGAFPWLALIVDLDDYSVACLGTVIHSEYVLTTRACITKPAGKYTVVRDWDILTIYNEYEAYKSYADPVCIYWPLGIDNTTGQAQYKLGGPEAELILLIGPLDEHHSEYPADKTLCLPSRLSDPPSSAYGYPMPSPYQPSLYTPYPQIGYDPYSSASQPIPTGECWVAGYYNSPTAVLQNHPPATSQQQPPYGQQQQQQYYNSLDNSKVPRRALVRQIQCPADRPSAGADDTCFVGVNGYDACVADQGTAILCVIDDNTEYDSGFANDPTADHGVLPEGMVSANPPPQSPVQQQPIQVNPAPQKPNRRRAILYGVVKATTTCMTTPPSAQQQSNYIVGARVNPSIKTAIQDLFWETGVDLACPTERTGDVLPTSAVGQPVQPPSPYQVQPSLQPQAYDVSIPLYPQPPPPQPSPVYSQPPPYDPYSIYTSYKG